MSATRKRQKQGEANSLRHRSAYRVSQWPVQPRRLPAITAEKFGITRQTANKHPRRLSAEGALTAEGNARQGLHARSAGLAPLSNTALRPTMDSCLNPSGPPVPKAPAPQHNNSFINSALKSGAAALKVSPASRPIRARPRSRRNALSLSLLPPVMPMPEN